MRHGITGLVLGIVIGSVVAGSGAFALGGGTPRPNATLAAAATPASGLASVSATPSVNATASVETTRPAQPPAVTPQPVTVTPHPEVTPPAACATAACVQTHARTEACVNVAASEQVCQPTQQPEHEVRAAPMHSGTEPATAGSMGQHTSGHDNGSTHE